MDLVSSFIECKSIVNLLSIEQKIVTHEKWNFNSINCYFYKSNVRLSCMKDLDQAVKILMFHIIISHYILYVQLKYVKKYQKKISIFKQIFLWKLLAACW